MEYYGSKSPQIAKHWGLRSHIPVQVKMIRECARPYSHRNYWLMQMLGILG